jgi:GNAT superfamily N-acetyltransferase
LADHPTLIPTIGAIRWKEWGIPPEPEDLEWWVEISASEAGRDALPVTWVAIDAQGQAVGAVGIAMFDIEERRDRSPWVTGVIVAADWRNMGVGSLLMQALESWVKAHDYQQAWVATGGRAIRFYQKCGWSVYELVGRSSGEEATVLVKTF